MRETTVLFDKFDKILADNPDTLQEAFRENRREEFVATVVADGVYNGRTFSDYTLIGLTRDGKVRRRSIYKVKLYTRG